LDFETLIKKSWGNELQFQTDRWIGDLYLNNYFFCFQWKKIFALTAYRIHGSGILE